MAAQIYSFADHQRKQRAREPSKQLNPSDVVRRFHLNEYLVYAPCETQHRTMNAVALGRKEADTLVSGLHNLPEGFPDIFRSGRNVIDLVSGAREHGSSDVVDKLLAVCDVDNPAFKILTYEAILNGRLTERLTDLQTTEAILSRRMTDGLGQFIPLSPNDLSFVACAVARQLNQDAFLAQLDILIPRPESDGTDPEQIIDVQGVIGVCIIETDGVISTFIPAMARTAITPIPLLNLDGTPFVDPDTGERMVRINVSPTDEYFTPTTHPPLGAVTVLSDGVALSIAYISQSDLAFLELMRDVKSAGGIKKDTLFGKIFGKIIGSGMKFKEFMRRMGDVLKPLHDAFSLIPEIGIVHGSFTSYLDFIMTCYKNKSLSTDQITQLFSQLFEVIKIGFEVMPESEHLKQFMIDLHKTLVFSVAQSEIKQKDFNAFDDAIRRTLGEFFPGYDIAEIQSAQRTEVRKPKLVIVK